LRPLQFTISGAADCDGVVDQDEHVGRDREVLYIVERGLTRRRRRTRLGTCRTLLGCDRQAGT
jgi:hypothetical protein